MNGVLSFRNRDYRPGDVELVPATEVQSRPIEWLWPNWFAGGKFHLLAGAPGAGKTTLAMEFAARISTGLEFPDGSLPSRGNVLVWSAEDDWSDGLKPRLEAAGADLSRVFFVGAVTTRKKKRQFDPAFDFQNLREKVAEIGDISLVILDPVVNAVSGDSHKNGEVRRDLQPIVDFAAETGAAVLGISHFSKGTTGRNPLERVTGSLAFGALPRIVMVVARSRADGGSHVLVRAKSNVGPDEGGFLYSVVQGNGEGVPAAMIQWEGSVAGAAQDLLGQGDEAMPAVRKRPSACAWLAGFLAGGPRTANESYAAGLDEGFSERTLERAKKQLGVLSRKLGCADAWEWHLPDQDRQDDPPKENGDLGDLR